MPAKNEITVLRDQITEEVNRDAVVISGQLFGTSAASREPDLGRVSDEQLRGLYRQKYLEQDRQWLQGEARRDPQQFIKVAREIGVVLPEELPGMEPMPNTLPMGPLTQPGVSPITAPPTAVPMPLAPGGPPPPVDPNLALLALQGAVAGPVAGAGPQPPPPTQPILQPPY